MKILQVITGDEGGGGRAAYRLTQGLRAIGCDSSLYVASKFHFDPSTLVYKPDKGPRAKLRRFLFRTQTRLVNYGIRNREGLWRRDHVCQRGAEPVSQLPAASIYNLHSIENFFNYEAYFRSPAGRVPTVWTIHLMAPFTGGCAHSCGCERFTQACGCCPILGSENPADASNAVWRKKRTFYSTIDERRIRIVCPSRWMAERASRSSLFKRFPVTTIPNGLDPSIYRPQDRAFARDALGLPADGKVVLFVTQHNFEVNIKGLHLLPEILAALHVPGLHLLTLGGQCSFALDIPHRHLGHVFDDRILSLVYNAADVVVIPSLEDNLPNVVMEAMACGIPVAAFETGGIPEMVRAGETGDLVPKGDVRGLADALRTLLTDDARRRRYSLRAREVVESEYTQTRQAERYMKLYDELLAACT
jgi:glycosyltransferase involved in cell wall biosynthesis